MILSDSQKIFYRDLYRSKVQTDDHGKKIIMLHAKAPPKCMSCGLTNESIRVKFGGWTAIQLTEGVALYVCPRCHSCSGSPDIRDNIAMLQVAREDACEIRDKALLTAAQNQPPMPEG